MDYDSEEYMYVMQHIYDILGFRTCDCVLLQEFPKLSNLKFITRGRMIIARVVRCYVHSYAYQPVAMGNKWTYAHLSHGYFVNRSDLSWNMELPQLEFPRIIG